MAYLGLDTAVYPGDDAMRALRPFFAVTGFYLRGPSHPDRSWLGKRAFLQDEFKYGLLPIFVAQETAGPGSHIVTAAQGAIDGHAAAAAMAAEGFRPKSRVFQDLENGPPFGQAEGAYVFSTISAIDGGGYGGAVYCSHALADDVDEYWATHQSAGEPAIWAFRVPTVARTTAALPLVAPDPRGAWPRAVAWQFRQNVAISVGGHSLVVDLNATADADPSAPL